MIINKIIQLLKDKQIKELINKIFYKLFFKTIIIKKNKFNRKEVLLYYKTHPFIPTPFKTNYHPNNQDIKLIVNVLLGANFNVTVIDRTISITDINKILKKKYDIFIANCSGNSAPHLKYLHDKLNCKIKVAYVNGPNPSISNKLVLKRHQEFKDRVKNKNFLTRRLVKENKTNLDQRFYKSDYIYCYGGSFSIGTYKEFKKIIFQIKPALSNKIKYDLNLLKRKKSNKLIYLGGSGNICKGLDLVIDSVIEINQNQEVHLDIFAPGYKDLPNTEHDYDEDDFWDIYKEKIKKYNFIKLHGFVNTESSKFLKTIEECSFNIFPASSEGAATSVLNCMRRAIIPVIPYEAGIDIEEFGIKLNSKDFSEVKETIIRCINMKKSEIVDRSMKAYQGSWEYTPENFCNSLKWAINNTIKV